MISVVPPVIDNANTILSDVFLVLQKSDMYDRLMQNYYSLKLKIDAQHTRTLMQKHQYHKNNILTLNQFLSHSSQFTLNVLGK